AECLVGVRFLFFFFFQAEDGIRDFHVTGVQTCALPISRGMGLGDLGEGNHPPARRGVSPAAGLRRPSQPGLRGAEARERIRLPRARSEEHTSELQSRENLVCRLLLEKKNNDNGVVEAEENTSPIANWFHSL